MTSCSARGNWATSRSPGGPARRRPIVRPREPGRRPKVLRYRPEGLVPRKLHSSFTAQHAGARSDLASKFLDRALRAKGLKEVQTDAQNHNTGHEGGVYQITERCRE